MRHGCKGRGDTKTDVVNSLTVTSSPTDVIGRIERLKRRYDLVKNQQLLKIMAPKTAVTGNHFIGFGDILPKGLLPKGAEIKALAGQRRLCFHKFFNHHCVKIKKVKH